MHVSIVTIRFSFCLLLRYVINNLDTNSKKSQILIVDKNVLAFEGWGNCVLNYLNAITTL